MSGSVDVKFCVGGLLVSVESWEEVFDVVGLKGGS
jgi:hypothetical protein